MKPSSGSISLEQAQALLGCSPDRAPAHLGSLKDAIAASRTKQLEAEKASYSNAEVVYDNNAPIFGLDPEKFSDQSTQESVRLYEKYTVGYDKGSPQGDSQMMVLIYNEPDGKNTVLATEPTITSEDAIRLVNDYERRLSSEAKR